MVNLTINTPVSYQLKYVIAECGVRYWEDATVNGVVDEEGTLIPCRNGDYWCPVIDLDAGKILNWNIGTTASIHYKVCDDGTYLFCDKTYTEESFTGPITRYEGYVPGFLGNSGDYVVLEVDENGYIANFSANLDDIKDEMILLAK